MVRSKRVDVPGARNHVTNRGIGKRVVFATRPMARLFLSKLARAVRRGEIRVEAFALLHTHYHLMARTDEGTLSYAMMRIGNTFTRAFNRPLRRKGPLMQGRFFSKPVRGARYFRTLVRYIDFNPVDAGLCRRPEQYEFGSARLYMRRRRGPPWLDRTSVEAHVRNLLERPTYDPDDYARVFGRAMSADEVELVERRLRRVGPDEQDALEDLLAATPDHIVRWMRRRARLADGMAPWTPMAGTRAVRASVAIVSSTTPQARLRVRKNRRAPWRVMEMGLLHALAGLRAVEIARLLGVAQSTVSGAVNLHREWLEREPCYRAWVAEASAQALATTHA